MQLIAIIDIPTGVILEHVPAAQPTKVRVAVRAVTRDSDGNIYLMYVAKQGSYKLPGGGVDPGESLEDALTREMLEETGYTKRINNEVGKVIQCNEHD